MRRSLLALTLLAALPFAASAAEGVSYNYLEGGYFATEGEDTDADGWMIGGSVAVHENFHLFGQYDGQKTDDFDVGPVQFDGVDVDHWRLGVGYNHTLSPNADLVTRVAYEKYDLDEPEADSSDGYSVEAGVRGAMTPSFEGWALAGYEDAEEFDGTFYGRLGAQYKFNQTWGVTGDVKFAEGDTQYFVGPRISF
jgi:Ax21 family sulfation-dependent quorum factor